ncbi:putative Kinase superfamily protein [Cinnamomum micranthum f. kanehirae]|uniref:Putative Kinase superfamily protein n=1 Tax=Cinnamomum micranthum f. kanehirae TaxID=337451 RepID=A0A443PRX8_9MAGN|nr:putative Kinase superfamily protein [Cinnamomum micranthum f. kanehirae]
MRGKQGFWRWEREKKKRETENRRRHRRWRGRVKEWSADTRTITAMTLSAALNLLLLLLPHPTIKVDKFLENYKYLKPKRYTYADLKQMTGQFKQTLGQGGYGSVFKGMLSNGTLVAVKVLKNLDVDGEEFINEVGTMGKIHHVNVVRLLGFCADRLKRTLVYEFMPNESLEKYIFPRNGNDHFLGWEKLQKIAIGIAKGIEYLHQGCDQHSSF